MTFSVPATSYDRFMGRYSSPLAPDFADFASVAPGLRIVDVGCGPGALTAILVDRVGASLVSAVDPSESFVAAARDRFPEVDVRDAAAEELPFSDDTFDAALAQLVVHFMSDPVAGLREMRRVTRSGGVVAACVWDHAEGQGPLAAFWQTARELDPGIGGESDLPGTRQGHLGELLTEAGLDDVREGVLLVEVGHDDFEEWWEPFTLGVGPAGAYVAGLDLEHRERLREMCRQAMPEPIVVRARAWAGRGIV